MLPKLLLRLPFLCFLTLIAASAALVFHFYFRVGEKDVLAYSQLQMESKEPRSDPHLLKQPATQFRERVTKDIWASRGGSRIRLRLQGESSALTLAQKKGRASIAEKIEDFSGYLQEEQNPIKLCSFRADSADYDGKSLLLQGSVQIDRASDRLFAETALLEAPFIAPSLHLSGGVTIERDGVCTALSDTADIAFASPEEPSFLKLQGNVRLIASSPSSPKQETGQEKRQETFATADTAVYTQADQTLLLSCIAPRRVLVWQEALRLSAPAVKLRQADNGRPHSVASSIEGLGDVHFSFDLNEQTSIDELLERYL